MQGVLPNPYYKKLMKYRRIAYTVIIVFGLLNIFCPFVAHADLFGYYIPDVYDEITQSVEDTNNILNVAFQFAKTSPYDVVNTLSATTSSGALAVAIINASKTTALVVATLLLMVDFVRKSVNFEWSSKWENVLLFLIKILIIKQVIQNADTIVSYVYALFDYINQAAIPATATAPAFLPVGDSHEYKTPIDLNWFRELSKPWFQVLTDWGGKITGTNTYTYHISIEAVRMFYPDASFPDYDNFSSFEDFTGAFGYPTGKANYFPTLELIKLQPLLIIMKAIAYIIFVIVLGRVFELTVYTIFAPLPLATFASETTHDVAKNFLKNYIATVLQITVIAIMFIVYAAMNIYIVQWLKVNTSFTAIKLINFIMLCVLGLGVIKSGTWSKKICGIA